MSRYELSPEDRDRGRRRRVQLEAESYIRGWQAKLDARRAESIRRVLADWTDEQIANSHTAIELLEWLAAYEARTAHES